MLINFDFFKKGIDKFVSILYYCDSTVIQRGDFMAWRFSQDRPVYLQISERIIMSIISGEYISGEQLPSVRQLALEAAVNPNTVQHAFQELENEGVIVSKGTVGRYVTEHTDIIEECRNKMLRNLVDEFIVKAKGINATRKEIIKKIEEEME